MSGLVSVAAGRHFPQDAQRNPNDTRSPLESAVPAAQTGVAAPAAWDSARIAADPQRAQTRAMEGFEKAAGRTPENAGVEAKATADAPANARTALERQDIPDPKQRQMLRTSLLNLGNAIEDGRFDPNTSNKFREQLRALATAEPGSNQFKAALAHLNAATRVLDQVKLAPGTKLAFDPQRGTNLGSTGLPVIDQPHLDADLYYKTADGKLHVDSVKSSTNALSKEIGKAVERREAENNNSNEARPDKKTQIDRQENWRKDNIDQRRVGAHVDDARKNFNTILHEAKLTTLRDLTGNLRERSIVLGEHAFSPRDLNKLAEAGNTNFPASSVM